MCEGPATGAGGGDDGGDKEGDAKRTFGGTFPGSAQGPLAQAPLLLLEQPVDLLDADPLSLRASLLFRAPAASLHVLQLRAQDPPALHERRHAVRDADGRRDAALAPALLSLLAVPLGPRRAERRRRLEVHTRRRLRRRVGLGSRVGVTVSAAGVAVRVVDDDHVFGGGGVALLYRTSGHGRQGSAPGRRPAVCPRRFRWVRQRCCSCSPPQRQRHRRSSASPYDLWHWDEENNRETW
ncbi:hypothetical protein EDB86DRAFT_479077 [Lactarius hatsudake]|nr:hypothetical protein EDB86DRAFT_479077 [Lactarius hatsudake]